jgi:methanethiol S-methyltransferase
MGSVILIGALMLWGAVHSWLASLGTKDFLTRGLGKKIMRGYRIFYNLFSIASFLLILFFLRGLPDQNLYLVTPPSRQVMLSGQGLAALLLVIVGLQTNFLSFIGLQQLAGPTMKEDTLITTGFFRFVRHPLYLFGLLVLWLAPSMTRNLLIVDVCLTVYIFVGIYFEERKLLSAFGLRYTDYKLRTAMIIPGLLLKRIK